MSKYILLQEAADELGVPKKNLYYHCKNRGLKMVAQKISSGKACNSISFEDFEKLKAIYRRSPDSIGVDDAAAQLGISRCAMYQRIHRAGIECELFGRVKYIKRSDFEKMQSDAAGDFDAVPVSVAIERLGLPGSTFYKYADNLKIKTFRKNRRGWVTNTDFKKLKAWLKNKPDGRKKSSSERNSGEKEEIKTRPECSVDYYKVDEFRDGHWWVFRCGFSQQEAETLAAELSVSGALFRASPHKIRRETGNLFKKIAEKEIKKYGR